MKALLKNMRRDVIQELPALYCAASRGEILAFERSLSETEVSDVEDYVSANLFNKSLQFRPNRGTLSNNGGIEISIIPIQFGVFTYARVSYIGLGLIDLREHKVMYYLIPVDRWDDLKSLPGIPLIQKQWELLRKAIPLLNPGKRMWRHFEVPYDNRQLQVAQANAQRALSNKMDPETAISTLEGMPISHFQLIDAILVAVLHSELPAAMRLWVPSVIRINGPEDAEQVRRMVQAMDLRCSSGYALRPPSEVFMTNKGDIDQWKQQYPNIALICYRSREALLPLFDLQQEENRLVRSGWAGEADHPYPLIVGYSIWPEYAATEIQFSGELQEEELKIGRQMAAQLMNNLSEFLGAFSGEWVKTAQDPSSLAQDSVKLWFQAFHFAAAQVLFTTLSDRMRYLQVCTANDAERIRIRDDRKLRYEEAAVLLKGVVGDEPWITPRPSTYEEAGRRLYSEYDAIRFSPQGSNATTMVCFTKYSLARRCNLRVEEVDSFLKQFKSGQPINLASHPVTFAKGFQRRMICLRIERGAGGGQAS